jgi:hypothetical protein
MVPLLQVSHIIIPVDVAYVPNSHAVHNSRPVGTSKIKKKRPRGQWQTSDQQKSKFGKTQEGLQTPNTKLIGSQGKNIIPQFAWFRSNVSWIA